MSRSTGRRGVTSADLAVLAMPGLGGPGLSNVPHGQSSAKKRKGYLPAGRALSFFLLKIPERS